MGQLYDRNYYICEALLRNKSFLSEIKKLKQEFADLGCPVPEGGFDNKSEYTEWVEKLTNKTQSNYRPFDKIVFKLIAKNNSEFHDEEFDSFIISPDFLNFMVSTVFRSQSLLNELHSISPTISLQTFYGNKNIISNRQPYLSGFYIQISPETRKDDIAKNWSRIQKYAKKMASENPDKFQWKTQYERNRPVPLAVDIIEAYILAKEASDVSYWRRTKAKEAVVKVVQKILSKKGQQTSIDNIKKIIKKFGYLEVYFKDIA